MKVILLLIIGVLAGPVIGYGITAAGCFSGVFGEFCGHNAFIPLAGATLLAWIGIAAWVAFRSPSRNTEGAK